MRLRFLTYNILDGGTGREALLDEIIAAQNADVILLQEVIEPQFVVNLAAQLQTEYYIAESNSPRQLALLTRLPLRAASSFHPNALRHGVLEATLEYMPEQTLTLFGVHLSAPAYTLLVELYRLRELSLILKHIEAQHAARYIIAGDFNSIAPGDMVDLSGVPWTVRASVILQGGLIARQVIGRLRAKGYVDCFRALHHNERGFTLPPNPPRVRLDYFFVNNILRAHLCACEVISSPEGVKRASDHLPVMMELEFA
ncbi:MAG TPA: endonuclease/exonuclease/phosphatase family protein [Anaerolineae bacterium]|nr:endonuclease/exonuclease/phosphatase family protein [Anaerolineae bacterium]